MNVNRVVEGSMAVNQEINSYFVVIEQFKVRVVRGATGEPFC